MEPTRGPVFARFVALGDSVDHLDSVDAGTGAFGLRQIREARRELSIIVCGARSGPSPAANCTFVTVHAVYNSWSSRLHLSNMAAWSLSAAIGTD